MMAGRFAPLPTSIAKPSTLALLAPLPMLPVMLLLKEMLAMLATKAKEGGVLPPIQS